MAAHAARTYASRMPVVRRESVQAADRYDYETEMLELARAQLHTQQRIASYVAFFFWLAFISLVITAGSIGAALAAHYLS